MRLRAVAIIIGLWWWVAVATATEGHWLLVDTQERSLSVMSTAGTLAHFDNLSFGVAGVGFKQRRGDGVTPLGVFRLGWVNPNSRFTLFFGLDYPDQHHAGLGLAAGRIDQATYERIQRSLALGRTPPQDTPLGGAIGIHGVGIGDPSLHGEFNWTDGCIALSDEQIRALAPWVSVGMTVVVR